MSCEMHQLSSYIFCYNRHDFKSLVILAPHQHILQQLLEDIQEPYYIWVYEDQQQVQKTIEQTKTQVKQRSFSFRNSKQAKQYLNGDKDNYYIIQSNKIKKAIIICQKKQIQSASLLTRRKQIIGVIQYSYSNYKMKINHSEDKRQDRLHSNLNGLQNQICCFRYKKCYNLNQLLQYLNSNDWSFVDCKQFPNFISLRNEVQKSSILAQAIMAMINQQIDVQTRSQIVSQLDQIVYKFQKFSLILKNCYPSIHKILNEIKMYKQLDCKRVFNFYTDQSSHFYILINLFLKAMYCSTEVYYIQPFFKDLFNSIKKLNKQAPSNQQFICYRGAYASDQQYLKLYESTGGIIQNLGFLSTSLTESVAKMFKKNTIYEIRVKNTQAQNYGFAYIEEFSQYSSEKQVLFNPLNYFKVEQIKMSILILKEGDQCIQINVVLSYQSIETINSLVEDQISIKDIIELQIQNSQKIISQGDALSQCEIKEKLNLSLYYWQKCAKQKQMKNQYAHFQKFKIAIVLNKLGRFEEALNMLIICHDEMNKRKNHLNLTEYFKVWNQVGFTLTYLGRFNQALNQLNVCKDEIKRQLGENNFLYLQNMVQINIILYSYDNQKEAYYGLKQCQSLSRRIYKRINIKYLSILHHMLFVLQNLGKYEEALVKYQYCLNMQRKLVGCNHSLYISTLIGFGVLLQKLGRYNEALQQLKIGQALFQKVHGKSHYNYSIILNHIAVVLGNTGHYDEALQLFEECLLFQNKLLGQDNIRNLFTLSNIATFVACLHKWQEAFRLMQKCMLLQKQKLGDRHPQYLLALSRMVNILMHLGRNEEALLLGNECLILQKQILGQLNPYYILTLNRISLISYKFGRFDKALSNLKHCLIVLKKQLGKDHLLFLQVLNNMVDILIGIGKYEQVFRIYKQNPQLLRSTEIPKLSKLCLNLGRFKSSLFYLQSLLRILQFKSLIKKENFQIQHCKDLITDYKLIGKKIKMKQKQAKLKRKISQKKTFLNFQ